MIDTDFKIESREQFREEVFKIFKEVGFIPESRNQTLLVPNELELKKDLIDYMKDKQCLVWLKSNEKGKPYNILCNQVYVSKRGSLDVDRIFPFSFEEVFHIWECFYQGRTPEDIYLYTIFDSGEDVDLSDVVLVIWALQNGRFNHILEFINEDRYDFDFKKYAGRF